MSMPTGPNQNPYQQQPGNASFASQGMPMQGPPPPPPKGFPWGTCAIGCLGVLLVSGLVCAGFMWYGFQQLPELARGAINSAIDQSEMAAEDKAAVKGQVDRVVDQYKAGKINTEQLGRVLEELAKSPLFPLVVVYGAEEKYLKPSGLSMEEKEDGKLALQRVVRGAVEKKISQDQLDHLLDHISVKQGEQRRMKDSVTDEELRTFLTECKAAADAAQIPDEKYEVKIGEEFKKAVDKALGEEQ